MLGIYLAKIKNHLPSNWIWFVYIILQLVSGGQSMVQPLDSNELEKGSIQDKIDHEISTRRLQEYPNCGVLRLDYLGDGHCDRVGAYNTAEVSTNITLLGWV